MWCKLWKVSQKAISRTPQAQQHPGTKGPSADKWLLYDSRSTLQMGMSVVTMCLKVFTYYFTIDDSLHKIHTIIILTVPQTKDFFHFFHSFFPG